MDPIVGRGSLSDPHHLPLSTSRGNPIRNERVLEYSPAKLKASVDMWSSFARERSIYLRSISGTYNCMGLAFANRRTWVLTEELEAILADDGYRKLKNVFEVKPGDLVIYRTPLPGQEFRHVGLVLGIERTVQVAKVNRLKVLSKWGSEGEYIHYAEDVPALLGRPNDYWTERRLP
jgi:hypothetical protein